MGFKFFFFNERPPENFWFFRDGYPNYIPEDVVDNVIEFDNGDDACAHVKAFGQLIDDWDDSPICEDALMRLFSWTLLCKCVELAQNRSI